MSDDGCPSKQSTTVHGGFEWARAAARVRRRNYSNRAGRRAALLGALTASYANVSRGGKTTLPDRAASDR